MLQRIKQGGLVFQSHYKSFNPLFLSHQRFSIRRMSDYNKLRHNLSPEEIKKLGDSSIAKFKQTLDEVANLKPGFDLFHLVTPRRAYLC